MQIKSRYPSPWSIGGGGVNLLTANQSNAETSTTGINGFGTLTRNTVSPIAGTADFKVVATDNNLGIGLNEALTVAVTAGRWYAAQALIKTSGCAAGRKCRILIAWYIGATHISVSNSVDFDVPTVATVMSVVAQAPATANWAYVRVYVLSSAVGEILYADSIMLEAIPQVLTIWSDILNGINTLTIRTGFNEVDWTDGTTLVAAVFPTAAYLAGTVVDIIVEVATGQAVTVVAHAAGGTWYTATGTLTHLDWVVLTLGNLEGSIANLVEYPYVLSSAEYQAIVYSGLSLLFNTLYIGNRYAGEIVKGSDKRLLNANGSDISALLGGTDIAIGSSAATIAQTQGPSARWYVEVKRTDV